MSTDGLIWLSRGGGFGFLRCVVVGVSRWTWSVGSRWPWWGSQCEGGGSRRCPFMRTVPVGEIVLWPRVLIVTSFWCCMWCCIVICSVSLWCTCNTEIFKYILYKRVSRIPTQSTVSNMEYVSAFHLYIMNNSIFPWHISYHFQPSE